MKVFRTLVTAAVLFLALSAAPAGAQTASPCAPGGPAANQYPPRDCGVGADRSQVSPGGTITLTGVCPAGTESVSFVLNPGNISLGTTEPGDVQADGSYSDTVTLPAGTRPGSYTITATCQGVAGAGVTRTVAITVVAAAANLPRTGAASMVPLTGAGLGLVALGGLVVLAVRRRRSHPVAS